MREAGRRGVGWPDVGRHATRCQHQDLIAQGQARKLVRDHDDGAPAVGQGPQQHHEDACEAGRRLVEEEQGGFGQQLERNARAFPLAPGELMDRRVDAVADTELGEHLVDAAGPLRSRDVGREAQAPREREGPSDLELAVQHVVLGDEADAMAQLGVVAVEVPAVVEDLARVGRAQAGERGQQRGLARTRGADDAEQRPLRQGEADVVDQRHALAPHDRDARGLEGDGAGVVVLLELAGHETERAVADRDQVALGDGGAQDALPVEVGAVEALQVDELGPPVAEPQELGVVAGHEQVVDDDVVVGFTTDPQPGRRCVHRREHSARSRPVVVRRTGDARGEGGHRVGEGVVAARASPTMRSSVGPSMASPRRSCVVERTTSWVTG